MLTSATQRRAAAVLGFLLQSPGDAVTALILSRIPQLYVCWPSLDIAYSAILCNLSVYVDWLAFPRHPQQKGHAATIRKMSHQAVAALGVTRQIVAFPGQKLPY